MKAVVVELKNNRAAVLSDDGCVITVKNCNYEIGQVIQMNSPKLQLTKKLATIAASAAAFIVLGVGTWAYASPYTYVSLDVNPSIEFTVNRFDRVLSVKAVNDDGDEILAELTLKKLENKKIKEALVESVTQISESGYFTDNNENGIVIATSSESSKKAEELAIALQETLEQTATKSGDKVEVEAFSVRTEYVDEAKELGVTPGKLNLVEKLQEAAPNPEDISIEEWLEKPVKDIMKATKDYKSTGNPVEAASNLSEEQTEVTKKENPDETSDPKAAKKDRNKEENAKQQDEKNIKKAEKEAARADKEAAKAEKDAAKADKDAAKADKDAAKADKNATEADKDAAKADKDAAKADKDAAKADKDTTKAEKDAAKADKDAAETDKDAAKTDKDAVNSDNKDNGHDGQADHNNSSGQKDKGSKNTGKKDSKFNQSHGKDKADSNSNNKSNNDKDDTTSDQEKNTTDTRSNKDNNRSENTKGSGN